MIHKITTFQNFRVLHHCSPINVSIVHSAAQRMGPFSVTRGRRRVQGGEKYRSYRENPSALSGEYCNEQRERLRKFEGWPIRESYERRADPPFAKVKTAKGRPLSDSRG